MQIETRPYSGEPRGYLKAVELAFSEHLTDADAAAWSPIFEPDRALAAYDGERVVGTAAVTSFDLTVPGNVLPTAGITMVGVHATHRRRGILRKLMRAQLDGIHERGEALAALWASEGSIYQRFGYGLGSLKGRISIDHHRNAFRLPHQREGTVRFVSQDEAKQLFPPVHDAVRPTRPGFFTRSDAYWQAEFFHVPEHWRRGLGKPFHVVHEVADGIDGYVRYAVRDKDEGAELSVRELMATTPAATLDLWRFVLDIDLIARVEAWNVAPDDPLLLTVAEPRKLNLTLSDALWLRIVDVPAALAARRCTGSGRLVVELADEFCAWNTGRWALDCDDGTARVTATSDAADLELDVTDLAAVYLGAFTFAQLAAARRVVEASAGAVARADTLFRTSRVPWCPGVF